MATLLPTLILRSNSDNGSYRLLVPSDDGPVLAVEPFVHDHGFRSQEQSLV